MIHIARFVEHSRYMLVNIIRLMKTAQYALIHVAPVNYGKGIWQDTITIRFARICACRYASTSFAEFDETI